MYRFLTGICAAVTALGLSMGNKAEAAPLLTIDISDPSAVVITGTGAPSLIDLTVSGNVFTGGIVLYDFLGPDAPEGSGYGLYDDTMGTLLAGTNSVNYNANTADIYVPNPAVSHQNYMNNALRLHQKGTATDQEFVAGQPAFSGSMVLDFAIFTPSADPGDPANDPADIFQPVGFVGNIYQFGAFTQWRSQTEVDNAALIGTYEIIAAAVPLPAGLPMLLAGLGGFLVLRRRA